MFSDFIDLFFQMDKSYITELKAFLGFIPQDKLCTLDEGIEVLRLLRGDDNV